MCYVVCLDLCAVTGEEVLGTMGTRSGPDRDWVGDRRGWERLGDGMGSSDK